MTAAVPTARTPERHHDTVAVVAAVDRLGVLADARDWTGLTALFTDRVDLDYTSLNGGTSARVSAAELVAGWAAGLGGLAATHHMITNHQVAVDSDHATCLAYFQATHVFPNNHGDPHWTLGGRYDVRLSRLDDGWRIDGLIMTAVWATGNQGILELAAEAAAEARS